MATKATLLEFVVSTLHKMMSEDNQRTSKQINSSLQWEGTQKIVAISAFGNEHDGLRIGKVDIDLR